MSAPTPSSKLTTMGPPSLEQLDDALVQVRRLLSRPGYRRRLRASLSPEVELTALRVLRVVERAGEPAPSVGDVAEALGVDPSSASRFVDQTVGRGLLQRRTCDRDRRRSRLHLTPAGRDLLTRATHVRRGLLAEVTAGWPTADIVQLGELLERLRAGFDRLEASS